MIVHFFSSAKFTNFNKLFQSQTPNIHFLTTYLVSTYKAFLSCYLSQTYIQSVSLDNLDPASIPNFLPLTSISMGKDVSLFLAQPDIYHLKDNIEHVQLFYVEASLQIKKRFPINDEVLKSLLFLNPATVNSTSSQEVTTIAARFPNIISPTEICKIDNCGELGPNY